MKKKKKKSPFPPDVDAYLGKYKIRKFQDMYDVCESIIVVCEDGRMFAKTPPYGISILDEPYKIWDNMIESLVEDIRKRIELATPYMDRKMRQL